MSLQDIKEYYLNLRNNIKYANNKKTLKIIDRQGKRKLNNIYDSKEKSLARKEYLLNRKIINKKKQSI